MSYESEPSSLVVLLCQPFLDEITRKGLFGRTHVRAIDFVDVQEQLYSIGAALGHALRSKLDILEKLLFVRDAKDYEANRIVSLCKKDAEKNLKEFVNEFGREPNTFGDLISYRAVENVLRNEGVRLSAEEAIKSYTQGDKRIKKIFNEKGDLGGGQIGQILEIMLLQGIHFGNSFPELTERMYQKAQEDDDSWIGKWHGVAIPEKLKVMSLEETERAVFQMVALYASQYYPELVTPLGLEGFLE